MQTRDIILACITDYGGRVRGKGYPTDKAEAMIRRGIELAPTNLMITTFGITLDTPWGPRGDVMMMPDPATETVIELGPEHPPERFILCDLNTQDGTPWSGCPRHWLRRGLETLERDFGLRLFAAFEHEFHYSGASDEGGNAYALEAFRQQAGFLEQLLGTLSAIGLEPEMVMPEYGAGQFEVSIAPSLGIETADRAVQFRETTRAVARARGERASFSPVMEAGKVGNGVHIHFSLQDLDGKTASFDPARHSRLSRPFGAFIAGIQKHMPDMMPLTAASAISYERLKPHRWSATYNNLGVQDREAGVRISAFLESDPPSHLNAEYRACDASANPYLALGALVWAGLDGLGQGLEPTAITDGDPDEVDTETAKTIGLQALPTSLPDAMARMRASPAVATWMGETFRDAYLTNKESELKLLEGLDLDAQVAKYVECF